MANDVLAFLILSSLLSTCLSFQLGRIELAVSFMFLSLVFILYAVSYSLNGGI